MSSSSSIIAQVQDNSQSEPSEPRILLANESSKIPPLLPEELSCQARHPYDSIGQFLAKVNLTQDKQNLWRLTEYVVGEINGLPYSFGRLVATNGILCYIQRLDGRLFLGHMSWFVPDERWEDGVKNFNRMWENGKVVYLKPKKQPAFGLRLQEIIDEYC